MMTAAWPVEGVASRSEATSRQGMVDAETIDRQTVMGAGANWNRKSLALMTRAFVS
jgi:hypothetical protein